MKSPKSGGGNIQTANYVSVVSKMDSLTVVDYRQRSKVGKYRHLSSELLRFIWINDFRTVFRAEDSDFA